MNTSLDNYLDNSLDRYYCSYCLFKVCSNDEYKNSNPNQKVSYRNSWSRHLKTKKHIENCNKSVILMEPSEKPIDCSFESPKYELVKETLLRNLNNKHIPNLSSLFQSCPNMPTCGVGLENNEQIKYILENWKCNKRYQEKFRDDYEWKIFYYKMGLFNDYMRFGFPDYTYSFIVENKEVIDIELLKDVYSDDDSE